MAAKEMYDYLPTISPDVDVTLSIPCQVVLPEEGEFNQEIRKYDDGHVSVISFSDVPEIHAILQWPVENEANTGTIIDIFYDTAKGFGMANSFKWEHPSDGHTYVIAFRSKMRREILPAPDSYAIQAITVQVLGKIADA